MTVAKSGRKIGRPVKHAKKIMSLQHCDEATQNDLSSMTSLENLNSLRKCKSESDTIIARSDDTTFVTNYDKKDLLHLQDNYSIELPCRLFNQERFHENKKYLCKQFPLVDRPDYYEDEATDGKLFDLKENETVNKTTNDTAIPMTQDVEGNNLNLNNANGEEETHCNFTLQIILTVVAIVTLIFTLVIIIKVRD
ncbi:hypothetical protein SNEBB_001010 [Seison nebaliae]|nr:hypothetical protein SNEBB_001010 [Seison nebaliae]